MADWLVGTQVPRALACELLWCGEDSDHESSGDVEAAMDSDHDGSGNMEAMAAPQPGFRVNATAPNMPDPKGHSTGMPTGAEQHMPQDSEPMVQDVLDSDPLFGEALSTLFSDTELSVPLDLQCEGSGMAVDNAVDQPMAHAWGQHTPAGTGHQMPQLEESEAMMHNNLDSFSGEELSTLLFGTDSNATLDSQFEGDGTTVDSASHKPDLPVDKLDVTPGLPNKVAKGVEEPATEVVDKAVAADSEVPRADEVPSTANEVCGALATEVANVMAT